MCIVLACPLLYDIIYMVNSITWISNYIHYFMRDVISHAHFSGGLTKSGMDE